MNLAQELDGMVIPEKVFKRINKKLQAVEDKRNMLKTQSLEYGKNLFYKLCKKYKKHYLSGKEANGKEFEYIENIPFFKYFSYIFENGCPKLDKELIISAFINEAVTNGFGKSMIDDNKILALLSSQRFIITIRRVGVRYSKFFLNLESYDLSIEFNEIKK